MRIDCAREAPEAVTADVAIVGSGAAGQAAARRLLARGCSVVLIESGGFDHDEAAADFNRGEIIGQPLCGTQSRRSKSIASNSAQRPPQMAVVPPKNRSRLCSSGW